MLVMMMYAISEAGARARAVCDSHVLHCLARPRSPSQHHVSHLLHQESPQRAPSLPGPAPPGPLQCRGGPHWDLHPPGHYHAADEETGHTECVQPPQEHERTENEVGPDTGTHMTTGH